MILHKRLKARKQDVCVIPFKEIGGISINDHQVQIKSSRQVVVVEFEGFIPVEKVVARNREITKLLLAKGVASWEPSRYYNLDGYKKPFLGVPSSRPSIFFSYSASDRRRRNVEASDGHYRIPASQWDPNRWAGQY